MQTYSYHVRHKNGWGTGFGPRPTHCHECKTPLTPPQGDTCATGYGCGKSEPVAVHPDAPALKPGESLGRSPAVCYVCCAKHDREQMDRDGRATLYLVKRGDGWHVTNWPGSLDYKARHVRKGAHNVARTRYDAWFFDHAGREWHAVNIGDSEIAHCRRLKAKAA